MFQIFSMKNCILQKIPKHSTYSCLRHIIGKYGKQKKQAIEGPLTLNGLLAFLTNIPCPHSAYRRQDILQYPGSFFVGCFDGVAVYIGRSRLLRVMG